MRYNLKENNDNLHDKEMTLVEHLAELRYRIIVILVFVLFFLTVSYFFFNPLIRLIIFPVKQKLNYFSLSELFIFKLKFSLTVGIILSVPVIIYQVWAFISPGLKRVEKRWLLVIFPPVLIFFLAGASFANFVVVPIVFKFLLRFAGSNIKPLLSISEYISFWVMTVSIIGFSFELPLFILLLVKLRIVSLSSLKKARFFVYMIVFGISATFTPPDVFSFVLFSVPLLGMFELTLLFSSLLSREKEV